MVTYLLLTVVFRVAGGLASVEEEGASRKETFLKTLLGLVCGGQGRQDIYLNTLQCCP